ncbi:MAG: hypothetical protein GYA57_02835 [Myxococcales bacterium]|nr:hypothetical protein [Myxococcales bacterium]
MKLSRMWMVVLVLVLAGFVAASCGDDDDTQTDTPAETGADADAEVGADADADADADTAETTPDVPVDVPVDVPAEDARPDTPVDVGELNTGEPCASPDDCTGLGPQCITEIPVGTFGTITFPGGYCSSECTPGGDECGPDGYCMDASAMGGPIGCVKRCTPATAETDCRTEEGYTCTNFYIFSETFCAPPISMGG